MIKFIVKISFILGFVLSTLGILRIGYYQTKAKLAQHLLLSAWQQTYQQSSAQNIPQIKPWPWADTWPMFKMKIPSIQSTNLVLKDASGESLAFGPGLLTSDIIPGDPGNSFIAAHRDTHFDNLGEVKKGDIIYIEDQLQRIQQFEVDQIKIVDSRIEQPFVDTADIRLTLVTCYPFDAVEANTPYRYLVSGKKLQVDDEKIQVPDSKTKIRLSAETRLASRH